MTDVSDPYGDELVVEDNEMDEDGNVASFSNIDLARYRRWLLRTPVGKKGATPVDTGEIIQEFKLDKDGNQVMDEETGKPVRNANAGKGRGEMDAIRGLQTVVRQDYPTLGIDVRTQQLSNGTTMVRWAMRPKRVYTDEQNANREAARKKGVLRRAEKKVATLNMALQRAPQDVKRQEALAKAKATLVRLRAESEPQAPAAPPGSGTSGKTEPPPAKSAAGQKPAPARTS